MRKFLSFTGLLLSFHTLLFASSADTTIVEITDATLPTIYYHQAFATPTKLVFKNLTYVSGDIYFNQNTNLVGVDFPLLETCDGKFFFNQNIYLRSIVAPSLTTVMDYLYISGNTVLIQLQVCNLKQIVASPNNDNPLSIYYYVSNNTAAVDKVPLCFSTGAPFNLKLSQDSIREDLPVNSFIGKLSATSSPNDKLGYHLSGDLIDNMQFVIRNDSLLSGVIFDYESRKVYDIQIAVINQLGEKIHQDFSIKINAGLTVPDTTIREILDTTLSSLNYYRQQFIKPTKLVFKNLISVSGGVYFDQNTNLVAVDFPLLKNCDGKFIFTGNTALQSLVAPNLVTVMDNFYISGNTALSQLEVCNLKQILLSALNDDPLSIQYVVSNNTPSVDKVPLCFSKGAPADLTISKDSVRENMPIKSFIGKLTATSNPTDKLGYYLPLDPIDNEQFIIHGDSLLSGTTFDYEAKKTYNIQITVVNKLGERTTKDISIKIANLAVEDTTVYVISDSTLTSVYYERQSFITPVKLIFTNLTKVTGNLYFGKNTNLIEANFPLLDSVGGTFYFNKNESLEKIDAPVLKTITNYLFINGNTALTRFNLCSLTSILPSDSTTTPYYYISGNNNLDYASTCLVKTNVIYVPITNIIVKPVPNTVIGYFISDAANTDSVRYFFIDGEGKETTNPDFAIRGDSVFLTKDFASYSNTNIAFDINAIRTGKAPKRPVGIAKSLTEKVSLTVQTNILNSIRYSTRWIGAGTTPANSAWENPVNWSSNAIPDANTDVTITSGNIIIGTNAICRSLAVSTSAHVMIKSPFILTITH